MHGFPLNWTIGTVIDFSVPSAWEGDNAAFAVHFCRPYRGRLGFDVGSGARGACREGSDSRKTIAVTFIVANDENYALAA